MSNLNIYYKPASAFVADRSDWCDDDRNPIVRAVRPNSPPPQNHVSIINACRDIIRDCDNQKRSLLWNEVEYANITYEFAPPLYSTATVEYDVEDTEESSEPDEHSKPLNTSTTNATPVETNPDCLEALVKNKTAYI